MNAPIPLFSDTATLPTDGMRHAMIEALLGDEQRGDDPTVNQLEARVATLLGKEAALLMPSATMANQVAMALHCPWGGEIVCHQSAHVYNYEAGGLALTARAQVVPLEGDGGFFNGDDVRAAFRANEPHLAVTRAVAVENTTNVAGGRIWPDDNFFAVIEASRSLGLPVHLDGARLWNAAVQRGVALSHWSSAVDTVSVCFSKGLGCPFGAVLAGGSSQISQARRLKQALGGALRQSGMVAGAMLYALDHHVERLALDHERARRLAEQLAQVPELDVATPETNLVFVRHRQRSAHDFAQQLTREGVVVYDTENRVRFCLHLDIDDPRLQQAVSITTRVAQTAEAW